MRDQYKDTMALAGAGGALAALSGVQISVYNVNSDGTRGALATIFQARTGAAQGPSPVAGAASGTNPFVTGATGGVAFFCEAGVFEVVQQDTIAPARIATSSSYWNSVSAGPQGIPTSLLAQDGGLVWAHLNALLQRETSQIGQIIEWWRPASDVPVPSGWAICDGRQIAGGAHDFPGSSAGVTITLPDHRNRYSLGADTPTGYRTTAEGRSSTLAGSYVGEGVVAGAGDAASLAPGVNSGAGSHFRNLQHSHTVNAHTHTGPSHTHAIASDTHWHNMNFPIAQRLGYSFSPSNFNAKGLYLNVDVETAVSVQTDTHSHGGFTGSQGTGNTGPASSSGMDTQLSAAQDIRPQYVGVLKLMKVKRS